MSDEVIEVPYDVAAMQDLAAFFVRENMENPRDNRKIRASQVGSCPVEIAHNILGTPSQPSDANSQFTFFQGHALGDAMTFKFIRIGWLDAWPLLKGRDVVIEDDPEEEGKKIVHVKDGEFDWGGDTEEEVEDRNFKGHYDAFTRPLKKIVKTSEDGREFETYIVTTRENGGKRYLLDFKTMTDRLNPNWAKDESGNPIIERKKTKNGWPYLVNKGWWGVEGGVVWPGKFTKLKGIPKDYWEQIHIYARAKGADGVMLVVMGKDIDPKITYANPDYLLNFPVKIFTSDGLSQETLDEIDAKADYIYGFTNQGELPPIPEEYKKGVEEKGNRFYPCAWCDKNWRCFPTTFTLQPGLDVVRPIALEGLEIKEERSRKREEPVEPTPLETKPRRRKPRKVEELEEAA
jgi:hypothetical protein